MKISILTLFQNLYKPFLETSLLGRAQKEGLVSFDIESLFSFCEPKERVDGPTYGHSAGMVLRPEIMEKAIESQQKKHGKALKIFFSPHGTLLDQHKVRELATLISSCKHILLLPARYEGMDARVEEEYADEIISIGNYVLMGGDIPAMVFLESVLRLLPGVVSKSESVELESFSTPFVDYPEYTAPVEWKGHKVPDVLRSGNHQAIMQWRSHIAAQRTVLKHFDWLKKHKLTAQEKRLANAYMPAHYAATMHAEVRLPGDRVGTTTITSFDIHDIARSAQTYGVNEYFVVTPLEDQQKIGNQLLDFWKTGPGVEFNIHRVQSIKQVSIKSDLNEVIASIENREGKKPVVIGTGARSDLHEKMITFYDQSKVWSMNRPVLFLFGTGHGLGPSLLERCDFMLEPLYGFTDFNHLSVRSAAGIIFDRWFGINPKYT